MKRKISAVFLFFSFLFIFSCSNSFDENSSSFSFNLGKEATSEIVRVASSVKNITDKSIIKIECKVIGMEGSFVSFETEKKDLSDMNLIMYNIPLNRKIKISVLVYLENKLIYEGLSDELVLVEADKNNTSINLKIHNSLIHFMDKNGKEVLVQKYFIDNDYKLDSSLENKAGYKFDGWYPNEACKPEEQIKETVFGKSNFPGDIYLYGHWTAIPYSITYNLNGGKNPEDAPKSYTVENSDFDLPKAEKNGYEFEGWYTDSGCTEGHKVTQIITSSMEPKTFYANWVLTPYSITYHLKGGENNSGNPAEYTVETSTIQLQDPTNNGYTFGGWYTDSGFAPESKKTEITAGSTGKIDLYAQFTPIKYDITYNLNNGDLDLSSVPSEYTVETSTITLAEPTLDGYTFKGWYTDSGFDPKTKKTEITTGSTENVTLYAKWEITTYSITYNLDGGTNDRSNLENYTKNSSFPIHLNDASKTGYTFGGWYTDSRFGAEFKITEITSESRDNIVLYAQFTPIDYNITYNLNYGNLNTGDGPAKYNVETATIILPVPTKYNYVFAGWYTDSVFSSECKITEITQGSTGDVTVYARWAKKVTTFDQLRTEIETMSSPDSSFAITQNLDFDDGRPIEVSRPVSVMSTGNFTIKRKGTYSSQSSSDYFSNAVIYVTENGELTIGDDSENIITLEGTPDSQVRGSLIDVNGSGGTRGKLTMNNVVVKDIYNFTGAINSYGDLILNNCKVLNNKGNGKDTLGSGDVRKVIGSGVYQNGGTLTIDGGEISGNTSLTLANGGAGLVVENNSTVNIKNLTIKNNSSDYVGGGLYIKECGNVTINNCTITGNESTGVSSSAKNCGGAGVYIEGTRSTKVTVSDSTISNNKCTGAVADLKNATGGGISVFIAGELTLNNTKVTNNTTTGNGGGIYAGGGYAIVTVDNEALIKDNKVTGSGKGPQIYIEDATYNGTKYPGGGPLIK